MAALEQAAQIKAEALAKISSREQEIIAIAEGILLPSKKVKYSERGHEALESSKSVIYHFAAGK